MSWKTRAPGLYNSHSSTRGELGIGIKLTCHHTEKMYLLTSNITLPMLTYIWWFLKKKKKFHFFFLTYKIRSRQIKTLAGRAVSQLLEWQLVGTTRLFCTLFFSQHLHFPMEIFPSCIPLFTSQYLENKYFLFQVSTDNKTPKKIYMLIVTLKERVS